MIERISASLNWGNGGMFCPPLWNRSFRRTLACFASAAASARLISCPVFFVRSKMTATEVARTGLMTELISGGAPAPDPPWHPWQFRRYRSEPWRSTVSVAKPGVSSCCQCEDSSHGMGADGPTSHVLPILVSLNDLWRCLSQLSPATGVTTESLVATV